MDNAPDEPVTQATDGHERKPGTEPGADGSAVPTSDVPADAEPATDGAGEAKPEG